MWKFLHRLFSGIGRCLFPLPPPRASCALTHTVRQGSCYSECELQTHGGSLSRRPLSLRLGWVGLVACCAGCGILSSLSPLELLQVEADGAQQHPRYRAHDRNWFSLLDAPQPRIFVEFYLGMDYRTSASVSVAQRDISNAWPREKLRYVGNSCRPLYFHPFVATTGGFLVKERERIRLLPNLVCGWRFAVFIVARVVAR